MRSETEPVGEGLAARRLYGQAGPMRDDLERFAATAGRMADAARAEALSGLDRGVAADDKNEGHGGFDPITEADRAAERAMRAILADALPGHAISGEEYGDTPGDGPWRWSLDPIDGTRAYICGLPCWTVLIALLHDERPVLGIIDVPRVGERYVGYGALGLLAARDTSTALRASACADLATARLATTDPYLFEGGEAESFSRIRAAARLTRYGYDAYAYARLAAGSIDLVVESGLKPHDYNALIPVVRAAGGVIGNWEGEDDFSAGRVVAAATPALFEQAIATLAG